MTQFVKPATGISEIANCFPKSYYPRPFDSTAFVFVYAFAEELNNRNSRNRKRDAPKIMYTACYLSYEVNIHRKTIITHNTRFSD